MPWIGTDVIITKHGDPFKGYMGVVKDVLRGQDTASGLKIGLRLEHVEFLSPFKTIVVDYDGVVEKRTGLSLLEYAEPRSVLFQPSKGYIMMRPARRFFGLSPQTPMHGAGGATPMPDQTSSSTPAWDPTSRTPRTVDPSSLTPVWSPPVVQPLATNRQTGHCSTLS